MLSASRDKSIRQWTIGQAECKMTYEGHEMAVTGLAAMPGA